MSCIVALLVGGGLRAFLTSHGQAAGYICKPEFTSFSIKQAFVVDRMVRAGVEVNGVDMSKVPKIIQSSSWLACCEFD